MHTCMFESPEKACFYVVYVPNNGGRHQLKHIGPGDMQNPAIVSGNTNTPSVTLSLDPNTAKATPPLPTTPSPTIQKTVVPQTPTSRIVPPQQA